MKKIWLSITLILVLLLSACGTNYEKQLVGTWYMEENASPAFTLYDDGTCEIAGEYGDGTWRVTNNQLELTDYYGETVIAPILSIENNCLILGDNSFNVHFWKDTKEIDNEEANVSDIVSKDSDSDQSNLLSLYQTESYSLGDYIAGTAIIEYRIDGEYQGALINRGGSVITELDPQEFGDLWRDSVSGACYSSYNVVDVEGNTIFTVEDGQRILCVGDSMILVYEEAKGFESAEARIGVVSFDGEWIRPMTSDNLMLNDEKTGLRYSYNWRYAGEGCFVVNNVSGVMNSRNSRTVIFDVFNNTSSIYIGAFSEDSEFVDGVIIDGNFVVDHFGNIVREEDSIISTGDGMYYSRYALYSSSGEMIKDYSQYENAYISHTYNGYGYFEANGADGKHYFSIIDSKGNILFDPILKERTYSNQPNGFLGDFYNGEFITDQKSFDISGNMIFDFGEEITSCSEGIVIINDAYMTTHGELIEPMISFQ